MKQKTAVAISALLIVISLSSCNIKPIMKNTFETIDNITDNVYEDSSSDGKISNITEPAHEPPIESPNEPPVEPDIPPEVTDIKINSVILDTPPFSYYISDRVSPENNQSIKLKKISSVSNNITDEEIWFINNNLTLNILEVPNSFKFQEGNLPDEVAKNWDGLRITSAFYDDSYIYCTYGADFSEGYIMNNLRRKLLGFDILLGFLQLLL